MCKNASSRDRSALKNVAKISTIRGLYGKDKPISVDLSKIMRCLEMFCNLGEQLHDQKLSYTQHFLFQSSSSC